jgi:hypothetical protein
MRKLTKFTFSLIITDLIKFKSEAFIRSLKIPKVFKLVVS